MLVKNDQNSASVRLSGATTGVNGLVVLAGLDPAARKTARSP
jgi:hypothetical protein